MAAPSTPQDAPAANQVDMDEILSSIRTGVEEESAKVGESADLIDAAAAAEGEGAETPATEDDDVLELSAAEMIPAEPVEPVVDLAAFAASGATQLVAPPAEAPLTDTPTPPTDVAALAEELLAEAAPAETPAEPAPAAEPAAAPAAEDDFDKLLAEMSSQKEQKTAEVEQNKQELLAEEPLGDVAALAAELQAEGTAAEEPQPAETDPEPIAPALPHPTGPAPQFELGLVEMGNGPQVAFPAEVLAMALRPMVQSWLAANLPGIVDKLVKEEIAKMTQG